MFSEYRVAPAFDKKIEPVEVTTGQSVDLECHLIGSPPIKVTWLKDDKEIRSGGNYKISFVDNTPHLFILKADKEDACEYICEASNDIGKDSCKTEVTVKGIDQYSYSLYFLISTSYEPMLYEFHRRMFLLQSQNYANKSWSVFILHVEFLFWLSW